MPNKKIQGLLAERQRLGLLGDVREQLNSFMRHKPANMPASMGDVAEFGVMASPFVGDALALEQAKKDFNQGNYGSAAFNTATALPVIGDAAMAAKVGLPALGALGGLFSMMGRSSRKVPTPFGKIQGVIGYHGSPHKFDQFDMSKIGTGEGAQAYGHGLYFAENPEVARSYSEAGEMISPRLRMAYDDAAGDWEKAAQIAQEKAKTNLDWAGVADEARAIRRGNMYKVDIPDEYADNFLDWDKPMKQQPESVQKAMKEMGFTGRDTGEMMYRKLLIRNNSEQAASDILNKMGIKGIRYLDQGSRQAGEGTRNFVVFDDKIIKMLEKQ